MIKTKKMNRNHLCLYHNVEIVIVHIRKVKGIGVDNMDSKSLVVNFTNIRVNLFVTF